jgi:large subunit ribosomal protein L32
MAVPKRKLSKSRKRLRRGHHKARVIAHQACPRCSSPKLPHRVCPTCGYYRGKKMVEVEDA